jgi:hypothetical protein
MQMSLYKVTNKRPIHIFQLQKSKLYMWKIYVIIFYVDVFLFKLKILIQWQIWHNDDFMKC